jgi:hypothetical protein
MMGVQQETGQGEEVLHADLTAALEDGVGALRALEASRLHMQGAPGEYDDARSDISAAIASLRHAIAMIRSRTVSEHTSAIAAGFVIPGRGPR